LGVDGAVLIDKPPGPTSHDVVAFVRRALKTSRVGHTGTLDPLATGLLVTLVGQATRLAQFLVADEKEYIADVRLGVATPTYDAASLADAVRSPMADGRWPTDEEIEAMLDRFRGSFLQTPPPYSAKKVAGVAAYEKARKNEPIELTPVTVTVRALQVVGTSAIDHRPSAIDPGGLLRLRVAASSGFYVRSLAHDIGQRLGCGAHLEALRRTRVGTFRIEDACTLDRLEAHGADGPWHVPMAALLSHLPAVTVTADGLRRASHGGTLAPGHLAGRVPEGRPDERVRVLDSAGALVAVAERRPGGLLHPLVVLR
jgi:tRNA pseudouridine55 synthase